MVKNKNKNSQISAVSSHTMTSPPTRHEAKAAPGGGGRCRQATRGRPHGFGRWLGAVRPGPQCAWSGHSAAVSGPPSEQAQGKKRAPAFTCTEQIQKVNRQPSDKPAGEDAAKHLGDRRALRTARRALRTARRALRTAVPWPRSLSRGARATPSGPSQLRPLRTASSDHSSRPQVPARDPGPHCF